MPYLEMHPLFKAEDPEAYKKLAEKGIMVGFPASIDGKTHREDNGIGYHSTVKFFNPDKDSPEAIHEVANKLNLAKPDEKKTTITPGMFKDRLGNDVYVIKLGGDHAKELQSHNKAFDHMGYPATYEYTPHISVDKSTWDRIKDSGATTAHEAGIKFHAAELKQGHTTLKQYNHVREPELAKPTKLAASEAAVLEPLEKGIMSNIGHAAVIAGAMATATPVHEAKPAMHEQQQSHYSPKKMLSTIADVESTGGKFTSHRQMNGGMHDGERAYGKYGLTPTVIRETIKLNSELKSKHKKAMTLQGEDIAHYMQDNPNLENQVAEKHLARLEHHFGQNPEKIGYAWLNGISGTYKADKEKKNIADHWHVKKIKEAYSKGN